MTTSEAAQRLNKKKFTELDLLELSLTIEEEFNLDGDKLDILFQRLIDTVNQEQKESEQPQ